MAITRHGGDCASYHGMSGKGYARALQPRFISLPSPGKQQREMIKFCVVGKTGTSTACLFIFIYFKCFALSPIKFRGSFDVGK